MHLSPVARFVGIVVLLMGWYACHRPDPYNLQLSAHRAFQVPVQMAKGMVYPLQGSATESVWGVQTLDGRLLKYDVTRNSILATLPIHPLSSHQWMAGFEGDSVVILIHRDNHKVLRCNWSGDTLSAFLAPTRWNTFGPIALQSFPNCPATKIGEQMLVPFRTLNLTFEPWPPMIYQAPMWLYIPLDAPKEVEGIVSWPEYVQDSTHFALDLMPNLTPPRGDTVFFTFTADPHVYWFKGATRTRSQRHLPADAFTAFSPLPVNKVQDISGTTASFITNSQYAALVYDRYRDLLYRIVMHSLPLEREDGFEHLMEDKPWSIQVIDPATMEEVGEAMVPESKKYNPKYIYPTQEGILIQKRINKETNQDEVDYTLFTLSA